MSMTARPPLTPPRRRPSLRLLLLVNALVILAINLVGARWPLGTMVALMATAFFVAASAVWQAAVFILERWLHALPPAARSILYTLPAIILAALVLLGLLGLDLFPQPANKQRPARSPSGRYSAYVAAPGQYWDVRIKDAGGNVHEETTEFAGHLNVYWIWDASDRLWMYKGDDGAVHYWQRREDGLWRVTAWSRGHLDGDGSPVAPPGELYPDHAQKDASPGKKSPGRE